MYSLTEGFFYGGDLLPVTSHEIERFESEEHRALSTGPRPPANHYYYFQELYVVQDHLSEMGATTRFRMSGCTVLLSK